MNSMLISTKFFQSSLQMAHYTTSSQKARIYESSTMIALNSCKQPSKQDSAKQTTKLPQLKKASVKLSPNLYLSVSFPLKLVLTYQELERLICGVKTVDIDLLKAHTKLSADLCESSNRVKWLWEILYEISDEEKIKFIKFCYAQERLPNTHEEFEKYQIKFTIKSYMDKSKKDVFPKADTCFFSLELPDYTSKENMKAKIIQAINLDNVSINADKVSNENNNRNDYDNNYRASGEDFNDDYEDEE
jgi:hypothetical protein